MSGYGLRYNEGLLSEELMVILIFVDCERCVYYKIQKYVQNVYNTTKC